MTAQGKLQAAAKSAPFDGRHHGLDGGLDIVDHRYEERPPHLGPKLLDVRPCCNNNADRWWGTDKANEHSFHTLAASKSLLCYVKHPSHCVTSFFLFIYLNVPEYLNASINLCLCACMIFLIYLATVCICLEGFWNQWRSFGLGLYAYSLFLRPPPVHLS